MQFLTNNDFDSRGDTQEFSDLGKLAKRFLKGGKETMEEGKEMPSKAYIQEVVNELQKGEQGECPICLEAFEDAVLTPCAHRLCRECLLSSWRNSNSGLCPVCRYLFTIKLTLFLCIDRLVYKFLKVVISDPAWLCFILKCVGLGWAGLCLAQMGCTGARLKVIQSLSIMRTS